MGCPDQLAVKQDFIDQDGRLQGTLATQAQVAEILSILKRVETGTDTTIPGAIANIFESLVSVIRDPIVAAINGVTSVVNNGIDSIENVIVNVIQATENVLLGAVNGVSDIAQAGFNTLDTAINATEGVIVAGIRATENVIVSAIEATQELLQGIIDSILTGIGVLLAPIASYLEAVDKIIRDLFDLEDRRYSEIEAELRAIYERVLQNSGKLVLISQSTAETRLQAIENGNKIDGVPTEVWNYLLTCGTAGSVLCGLLSGDVNSPDLDEPVDDLENSTDRELLEAIANAIGVTEFPGQVPASLLNSGDNPEQSGTIPIPNLTQFVLWIVKQMDALIGEFPIKIKIKDSDLVAAGNQEVNVEVKNIAEALGDMYGFGSSSLIVQNAQTNIMLRLAAEAVSIKTATLINQDLAVAQQDFLGYRTKRAKREAQSAFNIAKINPNNIRSLSEILRSENYKYKGFEFDDSEVLLEYLPKFMFAASIIKSVYLRTDQSDVDRLQQIAEETLDDANNGWDAFVDEINNPESFFNLNEPDRSFIQDFNDEEPE